MTELTSELKSVYEEIQAYIESFNRPNILGPLDALEKSATEIGKAWGHSWLGYQARVYYQGFQAPPSGAHFSIEFGFLAPGLIGTTKGDWREFPAGAVEAEIEKRAGNPDVTGARELTETGRKLFAEKRADIVSILQTAKGTSGDTFIDKLIDESEKLKVHARHEFVASWQPTGQTPIRDMIAFSQGFCTPPHFSVFADIRAIQAPRNSCEALVKVARQAFSHLERKVKQRATLERIGTNVFIGHGRSKEWKDLKDFIDDRMCLPWDEFNRVPVAGVPNTVRLAAMLDAAAIAFLVLTAEDETGDGKLQARMNVVHEVGLFQGRLGFNKAIVMLEDGCEEFSNIAGLGQIRFPKGNIRAALHEVELVLEREGLVEAPNN